MARFSCYRLLAAALFALPFHGAAAAPVPLANPGFEAPYVAYSGNGGAVTGAIAQGWADNSSWANVAAVYGADASGPHGGASAQRVAVSAIVNGAVQLVQSVQATAGNYYRGGVWVKGTPGTHVFLRLQNASAPYGSLFENDFVASGAWQLYSAAGFVTTTEAALFMVGVSSPGVVDVDDAALDATPGVPTPAPPTGPVAAQFFGMHVANFQGQAERNPGFEGAYLPVASSGLATLSGVIAQGWQDNSDWAPVSVAYASDAANPHGGAASQKVRVLAVPSGAAQLAQSVTLTPRRTYNLSIWLRGEPGASVDVLLRNVAAPYNAYAQASVALSATWTQATLSGQVGDDGKVAIMVVAATPQTFWVDDAVLTDASGKPVSGGVPWPTEPVGTLRLWDAGVTWHDLEPLRDVWDFTQLDAFVAAAQAHGNPDIVLTLGQSPSWASARPGDVNYIGAGAPAEPAAIADWTHYVRTLALRYRGTIRHWEIWNEPNDATFYTGSVAKLVELTKAASLALKGVDPANVVLSPPPYTSGYLEQFLSAGGGAYADVVAYHIYATPPENTAAELANVRLVMAANGVAKPLWDSEGASGDAATPLALAPAYLARKFLVDLAYGAARFDWYTWGPATPFCVATEHVNPKRTQTPAGVAFGVLQGWLVGATIGGVATDAGGTWQMALSLPGGVPAAIVWNPSRDAPTALPGGLNASQRLDLAGASAPASGNAVTATREPALFK